MRERGKWRLGASLALLICAPVATAQAADEHFDDSTMILISVDSVPEFRKGLAQSPLGRFVADPGMDGLYRLLQQRVMEAISALSASSVPETHPTEALQLCKEWIDAFLADASGYFAVAFSMETVGSEDQLRLIVHVQGGDRLQSVHQRLVEMVGGGEKNKELTQPVEKKVAGVQFRGYRSRKQAEFIEGFYYGSDGQDHFLGTHLETLADYVAACRSPSTADISGRLGASRLLGACGREGPGSLRVLLNMDWPLERIMKAVATENPRNAKVARTMGLTALRGFSSVFRPTREGLRSRWLVDIQGRPGPLSLLPSQNHELALPSFAPADALAASMIRLDLNEILDIAEDLAMAIDGEPARKLLRTALDGMASQIGMHPSTLVRSLEGSLAVVQLPSTSQGALSMMLGPRGQGSYVVGFKLNDVAPCKKLLSHPAVASVLVVEERQGHRILMFQPPPPAQRLAFTFLGDWLLIASEVDDLERAGVAARGEASDRLEGAPAFQGLLANHGGKGMVLGVQDLGRTLGELTDTVRMWVATLPSLDGVELPLIMSPELMPGGTVLRRYFGPSVTHVRVLPGGAIEARSWMPSPPPR